MDAGDVGAWPRWWNTMWNQQGLTAPAPGILSPIGPRAGQSSRSTDGRDTPPSMTLSTYAHVIDELNGTERVSAIEAIKTARVDRRA